MPMIAVPPGAWPRKPVRIGRGSLHERALSRPGLFGARRAGGVILVWLLALLAGSVLVGPASAGQLERRLFSAKSYPDSRDRQYQVFVPSSYAGQPVPMVMVLHGRRQTELNMINETGFRQLAEQNGFIVVYPFITSYDGMRSTNCWGFFLDDQIHQGAGEVEDLHQIALEVDPSSPSIPTGATSRACRPAPAWRWTSRSPTASTSRPRDRSRACPTPKPRRR